MNQINAVLEKIEQASSFGFREVANGARLFGHVPHVAPEAWLHEMFKPLSETEIADLEAKLGQKIPAELRKFFEITNGLMLFSASLSVLGKRTNYSRTGDDVWQPFCIVIPNTLERPSYARPEHLVIGSYRADGSSVCLDTGSGAVLRMKANSRKILNRWNGFWEMLDQEICRLAALFDSKGRKAVEVSTAPPPSVS